MKITGSFVVLTKGTAKLTATTVNGSDSGYDWTSSDEKVATVAADGTVTGVGAGSAVITATGKTTKASSSYNIVVNADIPYLAAWMGSGHADTTAMAFNDWNDATPAQIPTTCARCHSSPGFRDYMGDDGSPEFVVDNPAPVGTVIDCKACHNQAAQELSQVTFPSGITITGLGPEARCMTCHQGRESTVSVDKTITDAAVPDDDTVSAKLGFKNIHYFAAGATLEAGRVKGGYQYAGKTYDTRFRHVQGKDTCLGCHDQHSLEIKIDECKLCHTDVTDKASLKNIRMIDSRAYDYDGDGSMSTGIGVEIDNLRAILLKGIQAYVVAKSLDKICYSAEAYPYFFKDTNGDGQCGTDEAVSANSYKTWTARLMRAAYNYQVSLKDPGAFAHNAKYIIQLEYDSIEDLNKGIPAGSQIDNSKLQRNDPGHFDGSGEPARHWDANDTVDAGCARCHSGARGFRFYLANGVNIPISEPDDGFECYTCHDGLGNGRSDTPDFKKLVSVAQVTFPSGKVVKPDDQTTAPSFICMTCHQGREAKSTIDAAIATAQASGKVAGFRNVHYLAAGATYYGSDAQVGYEYAGKTYAKRWKHTGGNDCITCHNPKATDHTFQVEDNIAYCKMCHGSNLTSVEAIRGFGSSGHLLDYDGDGNTTEPLTDEIGGLRDKLLAQMATVVPLCYSGASYPYFFKATGTDAGGECSADDIKAAKAPDWDAAGKLIKAAHNYQISVKEPGAWAHNFNYMAELLIDSIADLGGDTSAYVRP